MSELSLTGVFDCHTPLGGLSVLKPITGTSMCNTPLYSIGPILMYTRVPFTVFTL